MVLSSKEAMEYELENRDISITCHTHDFMSGMLSLKNLNFILTGECFSFSWIRMNR